MDNKNKKYLLLLSIGLFMTAFSQIIKRYVDLSDFVNGIGVGIGLGLMLVALMMFRKSKMVR